LRMLGTCLGPSDRGYRHYFLFYTCHFLVKHLLLDFSLSLYIEIPTSPSPSLSPSPSPSSSPFLHIFLYITAKKSNSNLGGARNNSLRTPLLKKKLPKNTAIPRGNGNRCFSRRLHVQTANKPRSARPA
jgi:hypothetical protein